MTSKKFFYSCLFLSILIFAGNFAFQIFQRHSNEKKQNILKPSFDYEAPFREGKKLSLSTEMTGCYDKIYDTTLTIRSEVVLASKFLKSTKDKKIFEDAARMQTRYLFGIFNLDNSRVGKKIFMRADDVVIKIISVSRTSYPDSITVTNHWNDDPMNEYQDQAFKIKEVEKGQSAISIKYEAVVAAATCGMIDEKSTEIIYPKDPYLAYWQIPVEQYRMTTFHGLQEAINPCANEEMVEIKKVKWFWYMWTPYFKACQERIKNSAFYKVAAVKIQNESKQKSVQSFFPHQDSYDVSLIFGILVGNSLKQTFKLLKDNLKEDNIFEAFRDFSKIDQYSPIKDQSVLPFLQFLNEIPFLVNIKHVQVEWLDEQSLKIVVTGIQSNNKKITLNIFYGVTSIDFVASHSYLRFTLNAFQNSDFVFYAGHAGMGRNFSLQVLAEKSGLPLKQVEEKVTAKKDQGYFIVSCYSTIYFGDDIQKARSRAGLKTFMVRSASQNYLTSTAVGMLNFLRQSDLNAQTIKPFLEQVDLGERLFVDYYGLY